MIVQVRVWCGGAHSVGYVRLAVWFYVILNYCWPICARPITDSAKSIRAKYHLSISQCSFGSSVLRLFGVVQCIAFGSYYYTLLELVTSTMVLCMCCGCGCGRGCGYGACPYTSGEKGCLCSVIRWALPWCVRVCCDWTRLTCVFREFFGWRFKRVASGKWRPLITTHQNRNQASIQPTHKSIFQAYASWVVVGCWVCVPFQWFGSHFICLQQQNNLREGGKR